MFQIGYQQSSFVSEEFFIHCNPILGWKVIHMITFNSSLLGPDSVCQVCQFGTLRSVQFYMFPTYTFYTPKVWTEK